MPPEIEVPVEDQVMAQDEQAPVHSVPPNDIVAVEHPMIIQNLDNALKTFGRGMPYKQMMDPACAEDILPLFLRPNDPYCAMIDSQITSTTNVVLKITVPKRTGRKRKRGSDAPFLDGEDSGPPLRLDAATVFRTLNDNVGKYHIEPVGAVNLTHRYRGLADFHASGADSTFMSRVKDQLLSGNLQDFKSFKFNPDRGFKANEDVVPPPYFSESNLPYQWAYQQGFEMGEYVVKGVGSRLPGVYGHDLSLPIPTAPTREAPEGMKGLIDRLRECFEVRPIWTKRALRNYMGEHKLLGDFKIALHFVSYQFHGGPWRDANIKLGVDPRKDPQYRIYQTLIFKILHIRNPKTLRGGWVMSDLGDDVVQRGRRETHIFDGKSFCMDGRLWQICDITDPIMLKVFSTDVLREEPDLKQEGATQADGWFCNGTMAKARGIMRTKIRALQNGQKLKDEDFEEALKVPDHFPLATDTRSIAVQLPNVSILSKVGENAWEQTKKKRSARDTVTFRMNSDHGARRGKRVTTKEMQEVLASNGPLLQSGETGEEVDFTGMESGLNIEGNILDEEGDIGDEDDDDSLGFRDDSSADFGSDNEGEDEDLDGGGVAPNVGELRRRGLVAAINRQ